ncbi:MAG: FixH family protein [Deltaproteobacteria bacterium]|nr:FixH family protein [Deltaproteobacteria bacterium]
MAAKKNFYPLLILLLLGSFIFFSVWSGMRAVNLGPQVTDPDYYSKGLKYSSTLVEKRAAMVLGWTVSTRLVGRTLQFSLSDKQGQPVRAAKGALFMYLPESESSIRFPLQEVDAGLYQLNLTTNMTGEMTARLEFERDGARLNRQLLLNL